MKAYKIFILVFGISGALPAQEPVEQGQRKNTIKFEFTQFLYPNSYVFAYERVIGAHQTISLRGGYEEFPDLVDVNPSISVQQDLSKSGYKVGAEYRFYFKKENQYLAPRGIYIGPYISYHDLFNKRNIVVNADGIEESAILDTDFKIFNLGLQLGYQFVINHRWTIDFIILGPAVSNYSVDMKLDGTFTFDEDEVQNEILEKLLDRFPLLGDLLSDQEVSTQGTFDSWSFGWRYQMLVGYQFGRRKK